MPYSFTEIERQRSRTIRTVFVFLCFFYFLVIGGLYAFVKYSVLFYQGYVRPGMATELDVVLNTGPAVVPFRFSMNILEILPVAFIAFLIAWFHWSYTQEHMFAQILGILKAELPKRDDPFHQMFQNILGELSVATGGKRFEGYVLPTTAMNAFALEDFSGQAVIGLTEGLLSKLSRAQIEAVVAHEAGHILRGDSLETTMTISLYRLLQEVLGGYQAMLSGLFAGDGDSDLRVPVRPGLAVIYFLFISLMVMGIVQVSNMIGLLLNMFLSRQREFRADAIAVRLCRDPVSLAEALYIISHRWRGAGLPGENLDAIFIVSPQYNRLAESQGFFPDLFSTHPPVQDRIGILLDMAHADVDVLEKALGQISGPEKVNTPKAVSPRPVNKWFVMRQDRWEGPFSLWELMNLEWFTPLFMIKQVGSEKVMPAVEDLQVQQVLKLRKQQSPDEVRQCPQCHVPLHPQTYEGVTIQECPSCQGVLVEEGDVQRILSREVMTFGARVQYLAELTKTLPLQRRRPVEVNIYSETGYICPSCRHVRARMVRQFFNILYRVEIDKCSFCGVIWFDKEELEILQCLFEDEQHKIKEENTKA